MIFPDVYGIDPLFLQQIVQKIVIIMLLLGHHPENPFLCTKWKFLYANFFWQSGNNNKKKCSTTIYLKWFSNIEILFYSDWANVHICVMYILFVVTLYIGLNYYRDDHLFTFFLYMWNAFIANIFFFQNAFVVFLNTFYHCFVWMFFLYFFFNLKIIAEFYLIYCLYCLVEKVFNALSKSCAWFWIRKCVNIFFKIENFTYKLCA